MKNLILSIVLLAVSACSTTGPGPAILQTKIAVPVSPVLEDNIPATENVKFEIDGEVFEKTDSEFVSVSRTPISPDGIVKPRKTLRARVFTSAVFDSSFGVFKRLRLEYFSWPNPHFKLLEVRLDSAYFSQTLITGNQPEIRSPPMWKNYEFWICLTGVFATGLFIGIKLK